jgi:hypothetical protein
MVLPTILVIKTEIVADAGGLATQSLTPNKLFISLHPQFRSPLRPINVPCCFLLGDKINNNY